MSENIQNRNSAQSTTSDCIWDIYEKPNPLGKEYPPLQYARKREEWKHTEAAVNKQMSDIPAKYADVMLKDFRLDVYGDDETIRKSVSRCKMMLSQYDTWKESNIGMYIYSKKKGTGKTMLASIMLNELVTRYAFSAKYVSSSELIARKSDKSYNFDLLSRVSLLVIDDLGQGVTPSSKTAEWLNDILFQVLDKRVYNNLLTIYTSNLLINELPFNDAVKRRISDYSIFAHLPEKNIGKMLSDEIKKNILEGGITWEQESLPVAEY